MIALPRSQRGVSLAEMFVTVAILIVLAGALAVPAFRAYGQSRAAHDAAVALAEDIALTERAAQVDPQRGGASLIIESTAPLRYRCYLGRPTEIDPRSQLGTVIVARARDDASLVGGPIDPSTPLLFASNGSAQYVTGGTVASQHQTITLTVAAREDPSRTATVQLDLFSGAVVAR